MSGKIVFAIVVGVLTSGCSFVTSTAHSDRDATGELWYVRTESFLGITVSSTVLYCGPVEGGPTLCRKALITDEEAAPSREAAPVPSPPPAGGKRCRASALPQWQDADAFYKKKLLDYCGAPAGSPDPGLPSP